MSIASEFLSCVYSICEIQVRVSELKDTVFLAFKDCIFINLFFCSLWVYDYICVYVYT